MKLTAKPLAAILFVILFGGIAFTSAMNWWQTESQKVPAKFSEGEAAGEYNPADIRGSYTFQDIENSFNVPVEDLAIAFAIPSDQDPAAFALKDLESIYAEQAASGLEIGTASVRYFVALYTGLPYELSEDTYLLKPAVDLLKARTTLTAEQLAYLEAHTVDLSNTSVESQPAENLPEVAATEEVHTEDSTDTTIKGKTTFQNLLDWGVDQAVIEGIIGKTMPAGGIKVKDYCTENGLDFESIKTALQTEVDKLVP